MYGCTLFCVLFCTAVIVAELLPPSSHFLIVGSGILLLHIFIARIRWYVLPIALGMAYAFLYETMQPDTDMQHFTNTKTVITGTIDGLPRVRDGNAKIVLRDTVDANGTTYGTVDVFVRAPKHTFAPGDIWQMPVTVKSRHGYANFGAFDYERTLYMRGIAARAFAEGTDATYIGEAPDWKDRIDRQRISFSHMLAALPLDNDFLGFARAITVGDTAGIASDQYERLHAVGIGHVLAISGLHVGIVVLWAMLCMTALLRLFPAAIGHTHTGKKIAWGVALIAAVCYGILAGFSTATQRAIVMAALFIGGEFFRRPVPMGTRLALAGLCVVLLDVRSVLSAGFWLSFGATAMIVWWCFWQRGKKRLWGLAAVISSAVAPITAVFFSGISIIAPLTNTVLVPLISFVLIPCTLGAAFLLPVFPNFAEHLFAVSEQLFTWQTEGLRVLTDFVPVYTHMPLSPVAAIGVFIGIAVLCIPLPLRLRLFGVLWFVPAIATQLLPNTPAAGAFRATVFDVGHGLSVLIETQRHTLLYDTATRYGDATPVGKYTWQPYTQTATNGRLDALVLSHNDRDHIGGSALALALNPKVLYVGEKNTKTPHNDRAIRCHDEPAWYWDDVRFAFLPLTIRARGNNASCVLSIQSAHGTFLLTGDIEARRERALIAHGTTAHTHTVVLIPHHGSHSSSSHEFIDAVDAQIAVAANHINKRTRFFYVAERYRATGATVFDTACSGAIQITIDTHGVTVHTVRAQKKRWRFACTETHALR